MGMSRIVLYPSFPGVSTPDTSTIVFPCISKLVKVIIFHESRIILQTRPPFPTQTVMRPLTRILKRSLTAKLVIAISALVFIHGALFWSMFIKAEKQDLLDSVLSHSRSVSEVILTSLKHQMLKNIREDIRSTLESIGTAETLENVRISDTLGKTIYSSKPDDIGKIDDTVAIGSAPGGKSNGSFDSGKSTWAIYSSPRGYRVLSYVSPIYNGKECATAECHYHPPDQNIIGRLRTDFSLEAIDRGLAEDTLKNAVFLITFVTLIGLFLSMILWKLVIRPVSELAQGLERVSSGDLDHTVEIKSEDEIGQLAETFNVMTSELSTARLRLEKWNQSLSDEVEKKTREIRETQDRLIEAEKMAALGRVTADIAHGIRNPLTALGGFGRRLLRLASTEKQKEYANIIVNESTRLENILKDILLYSRESRRVLEKRPVADVINESILLFADTIRENRVSLELSFNTDLPTLMERDQLRQAIDNIISNALDVMPDGGILAIQTKAVWQHEIQTVELSITDTGPGVDEKALPMLFEPFYTTKKIGHGTGLGLSISKKIIEEHGGFIHTISSPGDGFSVIISFPYQGDEERDKIQCWEYMRCGRDKNNETKCPAFPHFGRSCWAVAGTLCAGKVHGTFAQKISSCRNCNYFRMVAAEKAQNS